MSPFSHRLASATWRLESNLHRYSPGRFAMKIAIGVAAGLLVAGTQAQAADRFPELPLDNMTPQQKQVAESIMSGPRKSLSGPFNAWLRSPELGDRLQKVGEYIRFKTSLPPRLNEFAILIAARYWTAQYE